MTIDQPTLPGLAEAERLRDEGMQRVTEASDDWMVDVIDRMISMLNKTRAPWSANNLRTLLERTRPDILEAKPQLMGARVRAAATRKEMVKVGYEPSTLPSTHAHPIAVWRGVAS